MVTLIYAGKAFDEIQSLFMIFVLNLRKLGTRGNILNLIEGIYKTNLLLT